MAESEDVKPGIIQITVKDQVMRIDFLLQHQCNHWVPFRYAFSLYPLAVTAK